MMIVLRCEYITVRQLELVLIQPSTLTWCQQAAYDEIDMVIMIVG